jgi:hypothetical protein
MELEQQAYHEFKSLFRLFFKPDDKNYHSLYVRFLQDETASRFLIVSPQPIRWFLSDPPGTRLDYNWNVVGLQFRQLDYYRSEPLHSGGSAKRPFAEK